MEVRDWLDRALSEFRIMFSRITNLTLAIIVLGWLAQAGTADADDLSEEARKQQLIRHILDPGLKKSFEKVHATLEEHFPTSSNDQRCASFDEEISEHAARWVGHSIENTRESYYALYQEYLSLADLEAMAAGNAAPTLVSNPLRMEDFTKEAEAIAQRVRYQWMEYFTEEIASQVQDLLLQRRACEERFGEE